MTVPLSDAQLAAIRERVPSAVCRTAHPAEVDKSHVWVTGSLSGANRCSACHLSQWALDSDEVVLLAEVDRLRAVVADHEGEVVRYDADHERLSTELGRLRGLLAPVELATWAEQLRSADLIPHPAFACRSTTSGFEAAFQVATTDQLTTEARERLLAELRVAFDETVRRVLGYHPATPTV